MPAGGDGAKGRPMAGGDSAVPVAGSAERGRSRWALARLFLELKQYFAQGWLAVPAAARRRWIAWMVAGFVLATALAEGLVALARQLVAWGALDWERPFAARVLAASPVSISSAIWLQTIGTDITLWLLVLLTAAIAIRARRSFRALAIILAFLVLDALARIGWATWPRARPQLVLGGAITPGFAAFPSGHTAKTLAVYGILAFFWATASRSWIERVLAFLLVAALDFLTAYGRMRMGAHWPSDLFGGFLLGLFWLLWTILALRISGVDRPSQSA